VTWQLLMQSFAFGESYIIILQEILMFDCTTHKSNYFNHTDEHISQLYQPQADQYWSLWSVVVAIIIHRF
jgi:hypothetical protein